MFGSAILSLSGEERTGAKNLESERKITQALREKDRNRVDKRARMTIGDRRDRGRSDCVGRACYVLSKSGTSEATKNRTVPWLSFMQTMCVFTHFVS